MYNKRGQGLSTNAIILIVLGIFVLIILIAGFVLGWGKLAPWLNKPNVKDVVQGCSIACATDDKYSFCSIKRELKPQDKADFLKDVTCDYLFNEKKEYNLQECPQRTCDVVYVELVDKEIIEYKCTTENKGKTIQALVDNKLVSYTCDA